MVKNQKGFAVLESLLILIIITTIGGISWYAIHTKHQTDKILSQADKISQSVPSVSQKKSTSDNLAQFSDNIDGLSVSFSYPDTYKVQTSLDGEGSWRGFDVQDGNKEVLNAKVILDQNRYTGAGSEEDSFAWQTFKTSGSKAVAEANRQTSIKSLNSNKNISDKYVGELLKIKLKDDSAWGYEVKQAYSESYKSDLVSGALVNEPTIIFFANNSSNTQLITGTYPLSAAKATDILNTLKIN